MLESDKEKYGPQQKSDSCKRCPICSEIRDGLMIACDICDEWYHSTCINFDDEIAVCTQSFACEFCILLNFRSLINYLYHHTHLTFDAVDLTMIMKDFSKLASVLWHLTNLYLNRCLLASSIKYTALTV